MRSPKRFPVLVLLTTLLGACQDPASPGPDVDAIAAFNAACRSAAVDGVDGCVGAGASEGALKESLSSTYGEERVAVCHRSRGASRYELLRVAQPAVAAHLAHGDGLVGDPVPDRPGTEFDDACDPTNSRRTSDASGRWNGTSYLLRTFTVSEDGPVDATATVSGFSGSMRIGLLGYNPDAPVSTCSTAWLSIPLPIGPTEETPTITAHWDEIPAGTYCLNVVTATPVPPYPGPYSWTATVIHP